MMNDTITIVAVEKRHLDGFQRWRNDPVLNQYFRQYKLLTSINQKEWFEKISHDEHQCVFSIISENCLVGCCGLHYISWTNRTAEFSIYINPKYQRKGYGGTALRLLLRYGFDELNLNKIWGEVYEGNKALEIYKKMGFIEDGILRNHYFYNGKYWDAHIVSMLVVEYGKIYERLEYP